MRISTRGSYALRVMVDLAEHDAGKPIPLKDIVARLDISHKYLENIMNELARAGLVSSQHGKNGGYKLNRKPEEYSAGEILRTLEGELAPVSCLECNATPCKHAEDCRTLSMWTGLYKVINEYLDGVSLSDLMGTDENAADLMQGLI